MEVTLCLHCMKMKTRETCEHCGSARAENSEDMLPVGTCLKGQYLVGRHNAYFQLGFQYQGWDIQRRKPVWIWEYTAQDADLRVNRNCAVSLDIPHADRNLKSYQHYFDAWRKQQTLRCPSIPRVWDVFFANQTYYAVMEQVDGIPVSGLRLGAEEATRLFAPLLRDICIAEKAGVSPDSMRGIVVTPQGYAKFSHFATEPHRLWEDFHGPLTEDMMINNIYAFCALLYQCLTGLQIPGYFAREQGKAQVDCSAMPPEWTAKQRNALMHGLETDRKKQTVSMEALYRELFL